MHDVRPRLIMTGGTLEGQITYVCSRCRQAFPLAEEGAPKQAVAELLVAFKVHVQEKHSDEADLTSTDQ